MILGTFNIKNYPDMREAQVRSDSRAVGSICDIWGGQEISPEDQRPVLEALRNGDQTWARVDETGRWETPIFYKRRLWNLVDHQATHYDRGTTKLTAKNSAAVGALFQNIERPDIKIAVVNTHLITTPPGCGQARLDMFAAEWNSFCAVVKHYADKGFTVFPLGDLNTRDTSFPAKRGHWLSDPKQIDKIGVRVSKSKRGTQVESAGTWRRSNVNSDHDIVAVDVKLSRPLWT